MIPIKKDQWNKNELILSSVSKHKSVQQDHKKFIEKWNNDNIYDRWWRKKYKVAFGSKEHLEMSHLFMSIEYKEDKIFATKEADSDTLTKKADTILNLIGIKQESALNENKVISLKGKELDEEFDNLDLKSFNDG